MVAGNHEIEADAFGQTFQAYTTRYLAPQPSGTERVKSGSNLYYSTDYAGVHTGAALQSSQFRNARIMTAGDIAKYHADGPRM